MRARGGREAGMAKRAAYTQVSLQRLLLGDTAGTSG